MVARSQPQDVFKKFRVTPGCWLWEKELFKSGYGKIQYQGRTWLAHRLVYLIYEGSLPETPLVLRHTCDVRNCVNPAHLIPGTGQDNVDDMVSRNRHPEGESHGMARVNLQEVREIRDLVSCGLFTQAAIAKFYGVKRSLISDIKGQRCWGKYA